MMSHCLAQTGSRRRKICIGNNNKLKIHHKGMANKKRQGEQQQVATDNKQDLFRTISFGRVVLHAIVQSVH